MRYQLLIPNIKKWLKLLIMLGMSLVLLLGCSFFIANAIFPLNVTKIDVSPVVVSRSGEVLRHFANKSGVFRYWIELDELSPEYLQALIAYEDRYFFKHYGINPFATVRAFGQFLVNGKVISGSSTLTMQVARILYPHKRTVLGKLSQMFRAVQIERKLSKNEILTLYINLAPMGGNIEGVQAASLRYFSKQAQNLNLAESALLVALPQKPSLYRPDLYLENAHKARNKVLDRLVKFKLADQERIEQIKKDPVNYNPQTSFMYAPLISEQLIAQNPGINRITTTIDKNLQTKLETFIKRTSNKWSARISGAILVINNQNHQIYAYIGSPDLFAQDRFGYIDMIKALRSPGSTLKPFAYAMAIDYGIIHEASLLTDVLRNFNGYVPKNFDKQFRGAVSMKEALQTSLNVPIIQVMSHLTPHRFIKTIRDAQISILVDEPNLSVVLGGVGINLLEQARLFSSLVNEGKVHKLVLNPEDKAVETGQIMSTEASFIIYKILSDIRPQNRFNQRKIAWKTGTSYGYRDAFAFGVSSDWTVGVWIGRPDGVPNVGTLANQYATPLLFDVFNFLPKDQNIVVRPDSLTQESICWPSGLKITITNKENCEQVFTIDAINGHVPPTLYDAPGETAHDGWPLLLKQSPKNWQQPKITTFADKSIIFKSTNKILLKARGIAPFTWYLNGQMLVNDELDIAKLPLGKSRLSVQDKFYKSDSIEIEIRTN